MWDPYSHTGHIKVAVVNEDKGDKVRGKKINVGNTLEDNLKKTINLIGNLLAGKRQTMKLKWVNIMGIYIPKEFSHQITGTLRKKPQKPISNIKLIKNQCRRTEND